MGPDRGECIYEYVLAHGVDRISTPAKLYKKSGRSPESDLLVLQSKRLVQSQYFLPPIYLSHIPSLSISQHFITAQIHTWQEPFLHHGCLPPRHQSGNCPCSRYSC